jgi:hypothetical protein
MKIAFIDKQGNLMTNSNNYKNLEVIEVRYSFNKDLPLLSNKLIINIKNEKIKIEDEKANVNIITRLDDIKINNGSVYDFLFKTIIVGEEDLSGKFDYFKNLKLNIGNSIEVSI